MMKIKVADICNLDFVAFPYELSNKFIEDFERIIEFVERKKIYYKGDGFNSPLVSDSSY